MLQVWLPSMQAVLSFVSPSGEGQEVDTAKAPAAGLRLLIQVDVMLEKVILGWEVDDIYFKSTTTLPKKLMFL